MVSMPKVIRAKNKPIVKIKLPPKVYDQKLLDQIHEMKQFPEINKDDIISGNGHSKSIQGVHDPVQKERFMVKAAGLLYDFQNPLQTEADIKRATENQFSYSEEELNKAFGIKDEKVVSEYSSVYKSNINWKFLEALRVNGPYSNTLEKILDFVTGIDYTHLQADVNDSFPDNDMKSIELEKINNNFVIYSLKNELEEIDRVVGLRHKIISLFVNKLTFGRAAEKIVVNKTTLLPETIEILFPMQLGRVFYTERTKKIVGIEYEDPKEKLIPATKLIYSTNRDYGQSPGSLFYGYSQVEFFQPLIETDFIIDNYDLKEINRAQYTGKKIIQVLDKEDNTVTVMRKNLETSDMIVTKHGVVKTDLDASHEGNFLVEERYKNEDKIISDLGLPPILGGRIASDTYATTQQVMQSFQETTVQKYRMEIREIFEEQYYQKNLRQIIKNRLEFLNQIKLKYEGTDRTSDTILEELLVFNKDVLSQEEIEEKDLLKQELKMQKDRENWEKYRELFFNKRLAIIKKIINESISFDAAEADRIFNEIKTKIEKNQSFELEDLGLEKGGTSTKINTSKNGNDDLKEPTKENDPTDDLEEAEGWNDTSVPSPSDIEFEIAELEKLVVLDPAEYNFKLKMVFKDVTMITKLENTAAVISKKKEGIINLNDSRNELGYEDIVSREALEDNLNQAVQDIIKRYIKPEQLMDQQFGIPQDGQQIQMFDSNGQPLPPQNNEGLQKEDGQQQNQKKTGGKTVGISIQQRTKNQTDKSPRVVVDKTSVKRG